MVGQRLGECPTRALVAACLRDHPGACILQVARHLGLDWRTVEYHLRVLEGQGLIVQHRLGRQRRFVHANDPVAWMPDPLESGARRRILEALHQMGTATATDLARVLSLARSGVSRHLGILEQGGLVVRAPSGGSVVFAPALPDHGCPRGVHLDESPADPV